MDRYVKTNWVNGQQPAINETNLNKIENGIFDVTETAIANADTIETILGILNNIQITGEITISDFLLASHPIGSIYQSANSTSPATLFGGTWQRLEDVFIVAAGENHEAGSTGGESEHTLTIEEMPMHNHFLVSNTSQGNENTISILSVFQGSDTNVSTRVSGNTGGSQPHNNEPPYIAMYTWVRTA